MHIDEFDYQLPEELIAQYPSKNRTDANLLIVNRERSDLKIEKFANIIDYLSENDLLVINETKVIPSRIFGKKETGAKIELFLLKKLAAENCWEALIKPAKRLKVGGKIFFKSGFAIVKEIRDNGNRVLEFFVKQSFEDFLNEEGRMPLPPYIKREAEVEDTSRYQTVFAQKEGAVAAPTAGLHFNLELLEKIEQKGIKIVRVLLHVGIGTFRPVKTEMIEEHQMHQEYYYISEDSAKLINEAKANKKKIVAVGTTSVRALESAFKNGLVESGEGNTGIFIYPGYEFKVVDKLITNFHLPKSTLIMLVAAFSSLELTRKAYQKAVESKFKFFSYGDSMLIE